MKRVLILALFATLILLAIGADVGALATTKTDSTELGQFTIFGGMRYNFASSKDGVALNAGIKTPFPLVDLGPISVLTHGEMGSGSWADVSTDLVAIFKLPAEILPGPLRKLPIYGGPIFGPGFDATKLADDPTWYFRGAAGALLAADFSSKSGIAIFYRYLFKAGPQGDYQDGNSVGLVGYLRL